MNPRLVYISRLLTFTNNSAAATSEQKANGRFIRFQNQ